MNPTSENGRRELIAIVIAGFLVQITIGTVATLHGAPVAWGSLLHRPLILVGISFVVFSTKYLGYLLLITWFSLMALLYAYGGFKASYALLMIVRWIAALFFGFGATRLATSPQIRAYRHTKGVHPSQ